MHQPLTPKTLSVGAEQLAKIDPDLGRLFLRLGSPPLWATLVQIIIWRLETSFDAETAAIASTD